jgi:hypothetical protein
MHVFSITSIMPEIPKAERYNRALQEWHRCKDDIDPPSIRRIAAKWGINHVTLTNRVHGKAPRKETNASLQRLSPGEEDSLVEWIQLLEGWGHPPRIEQLRGMASELLQAKGDREPLGVHWHDKFLRRHLSLRKRFVTGLEKDRAFAEDPEIFMSWFRLYEHYKTTFNVHDNDIYNMDEKGVLMGDIGKVKVIVSADERRKAIIASGSRK